MHALFTAPDLAWPAEAGAMPWSAQLRLREGPCGGGSHAATLKRARGEARALQTLAASAGRARIARTRRMRSSVRSRCRRGNSRRPRPRCRKHSQPSRGASALSSNGASPPASRASTSGARRSAHRPRRLERGAPRSSPGSPTPYPAGHDLRRSFLGASAVREVLDRAGRARAGPRVVVPLPDPRLRRPQPPGCGSPPHPARRACRR